MNTSDFDRYKVDHLFLLMGENPLPNYVAARLLLNRGGTPYLVYTTHTEKQTKRLEKILHNEPIGLNPAQLVPLNEYESDAYHINKEICSRLEKISQGKAYTERSRSIGLNYTGGTKAMAVHAYRAIFSQEYPGTIFSYLDPRRLEMCIDQEDGERIRIKIKPDLLEVKLAKLFQIHGLELKHEPSNEVKLSNLAAVLAQVFQNEDQRKQWFAWYYDDFCAKARQKKNGKGDEWEKENNLEKLLIPSDKLLSEIVTEFKKEKLISPDHQLSFNQIQTKSIFPKLEYFCKYLDGLWLEHYVLEIVKNLPNNHSIKDYGLNFEIKNSRNIKGFEFDVAFTRGYQLFAISCTTTSKRGLCKLKLFEAYLRARQMGGDEARVALVCCNNDPKSLESEIAMSLDDKKIAVFGQQDLVSLSNKIEQWIRQNDIAIKN